VTAAAAAVAAATPRRDGVKGGSGEAVEGVNPKASLVTASPCEGTAGGDGATLRAPRREAVFFGEEGPTNDERRGGVVGELTTLTFFGARTGELTGNDGGNGAAAPPSPSVRRFSTTEKLASCAPTTMMSYSRLPPPPNQALRSNGGSALPTFHVHTSIESLDMVAATSTRRT